MSLSSTGIEVKKPGAANALGPGNGHAETGCDPHVRCPGEKEAAKEVDP